MEQSASETWTKTGIEDTVWDCVRAVTGAADMMLLVALRLFASGYVAVIARELEMSQTVHACQLPMQVVTENVILLSGQPSA